MYDNSKPQNNQSNVINDCPESFVDLSPSTPAPRSSWVSNPFDQLYQIEDCVYDNAPPHVKELISDLQESHFNYYTVDHFDSLATAARHNQFAYVKNAIIYYDILTKRLYKSKYSNFNHCAQVEFHKTANRCKQIIEAGAVTLKLLAAGHTILPLNSSQAYAMSRLDDETLVKVWEKVLDMYAPHEITGDKIKLVAYPPEPSEVLQGTSINVMPSTLHKLVVGAFKFKMTIDDYIEHLIELQKCKFYLLLSMVSFNT